MSVQQPEGSGSCVNCPDSDGGCCRKSKRAVRPAVWPHARSTCRPAQRLGERSNTRLCYKKSFCRCLSVCLSSDVAQPRRDSHRRSKWARCRQTGLPHAHSGCCAAQRLGERSDTSLYYKNSFGRLVGVCLFVCPAAWRSNDKTAAGREACHTRTATLVLIKRLTAT